MSSTKETSTTKTAHVMNLLRKTIPAEPEPTTTSEAPQQAAAPAQPQTTPQTPPIITSIQEEAEVSNQIKNALEDALSAADVAVPEPAEAEIHLTPEPEPEPEPEEVPPPEPEPEAAAPEAEPQASIPEQTVSEPTPKSEPAAPAAVTVEPFEPANTEVETSTGILTYVNVMQALVDEKAPKYMKMFGLCECPRCQADVKALALNRLDPKYVVMPKDGAIPRLTLYEGQYSSAVIAQLLYACKVVMESPRHDR